jgi:hypothetical protein
MLTPLLKLVRVAYLEILLYIEFYYMLLLALIQFSNVYACIYEHVVLATSPQRR